MRKYLFLSLSSFILLSLASCSHDNEPGICNETDLPQVITIAGKQIEKIDGTLSFDTENDLKEIADNLLHFTPTKSVDGALDVDYSQITKLKDAGFVSLYDVFSNAMNDVDSYYSRPGGYEEFKIKYNTLFFPEVGDDISPYMPISDEKLAMLADENGNVMIGNKIVSMIDITTYQHLVDLELTPPGDHIATKADDELKRGDTVKGTNGIPESRVGANKVWVKVKRGMDNRIPYLKAEVCFRKKYTLGWSNHNSNTDARLSGSVLRMYAYSQLSESGWSSHDYKYSIPVIQGSGYTYAINETIVINHGGTGLRLELKCEYDSYLP